MLRKASLTFVMIFSAICCRFAEMIRNIHGSNDDDQTMPPRGGGSMVEECL
jgi:hypothetical protein